MSWMQCRRRTPHLPQQILCSRMMPGQSILGKKLVHIANPKASSKVRSNGLNGPIDCTIGMSQFAEEMTQLQPDRCASCNSCVALLSRQLFLEAKAVRSSAPLAVILPGQQNSDLIAAGFQESSFSVHWPFLFDTVQNKYFRTQSYNGTVGDATCHGQRTRWKQNTEWKTEATTEFSVYITKTVFDPDTWKSYTAECRCTIPEVIRSLHKDLNSETCVFYGWPKLDDATHRASFCAPSKTYSDDSSGLWHYWSLFSLRRCVVLWKTKKKEQTRQQYSGSQKSPLRMLRSFGMSWRIMHHLIPSLTPKIPES